jgi:hypothetical protein
MTSQFPLRTTFVTYNPNGGFKEEVGYGEILQVNGSVLSLQHEMDPDFWTGV